jgi:MCP family monocarboxylic acid transporter-like MFS transporter 10
MHEHVFLSTAWIGSVAYGLSMFFGPVASALVNRFGQRVVLVAGGLLCALAVLSSSFVTQLNQMFGTFSVIYGIGACMAISPTMTIAPLYFDKYMTLAVGLMTAGSSLGTLVMAPLSQTLIETIGWRKTFRCFAGTCLFSSLCCCMVQPVPSSYRDIPLQAIKRSSVKNLMQDLKLWKNRVFVVWTCGITCVMFGYYIPYVHLVSHLPHFTPKNFNNVGVYKQQKVAATSQRSVPYFFSFLYSITLVSKVSDKMQLLTFDEGNILIIY